MNAQKLLDWRLKDLLKPQREFIKRKDNAIAKKRKSEKTGELWKETESSAVFSILYFDHCLYAISSLSQM